MAARSCNSSAIDSADCLENVTFGIELAFRLQDLRGMTEDSSLVPGHRTWRFAAL